MSTNSAHIQQALPVCALVVLTTTRETTISRYTCEQTWQLPQMHMTISKTGGHRCAQHGPLAGGGRYQKAHSQGPLAAAVTGNPF